MAIVVEEGKKSANVMGLLGWLVVFVVIGCSIYYIFFAAPQLVVIPPTGNLSTIAPITQLNLNPQQVIGSPAFTALTSTIVLPTPQAPVSVGRPDPFIVP
jgi:hypothetical protein